MRPAHVVCQSCGVALHCGREGDEMEVGFEDDGLNESQPAGSVPDLEPDLLIVEDFGRDEPAEPEAAEYAEEVL